MSPGTQFNFQAKVDDTSDFEQQKAMLDNLAQSPAVVSLRQWSTDQLAAKSGDDALDVGCGLGDELARLAHLVSPAGRATGLEPNSPLRREAARRLDGLATLVDGSAEDLPFEDAAFDVIRCERVLQHLNRPEAAASEISRVLRPGGRCVLLDTDWGTLTLHPADPDVFRRAHEAFVAALPNGHSGRTLRSLLSAAGLVVREVAAETWIADSNADLGPITLLPVIAAHTGAITADEAAELERSIRESWSAGMLHVSATMFAVIAEKPRIRD